MEVAGFLTVQIVIVSLFCGLRFWLRYACALVGLVCAYNLVSEQLFGTMCILAALSFIMSSAPTVRYAERVRQ